MKARTGPRLAPGGMKTQMRREEKDNRSDDESVEVEITATR